tara:strand:+ start:346 stop:693 length:348 start_codon:yes stop_codon:yes gene_type:complete
MTPEEMEKEMERLRIMTQLTQLPSAWQILTPIEVDKFTDELFTKATEYLKWFNGRLTTYKPTGEQLDLLWHDIDDGKFGTEAKTGQWYTSIKDIKEEHAKASNLAELKAQIEGMI